AQPQHRASQFYLTLGFEADWQIRAPCPNLPVPFETLHHVARLAITVPATKGSCPRTLWIIKDGTPSTVEQANTAQIGRLCPRPQHKAGQDRPLDGFTCLAQAAGKGISKSPLTRQRRLARRSHGWRARGAAAGLIGRQA